MTVDEFVVALSATSGPWELARTDGAIRCRDRCPLVEVARVQEALAWHVAAERLHMTMKDAERIVRASDGVWEVDVDLRKQLLAATVNKP